MNKFRTFFFSQSLDVCIVGNLMHFVWSGTQGYFCMFFAAFWFLIDPKNDVFFRNFSKTTNLAVWFRFKKETKIYIFSTNNHLLLLVHIVGLSLSLHHIINLLFITCFLFPSTHFHPLTTSPLILSVWANNFFLS